MKNVAMMSNKQLNAVLAQLDTLGATVYRGEIIKTVHAPNGKKVLNTALIKTRTSEQWHVRAVQGLLTAA